MLRDEVVAAWTISGRSSSRRGLLRRRPVRDVRIVEDVGERAARRAGSTYSATTSSAFVRVNRNENGDLRMSRTQATEDDSTNGLLHPIRILGHVKAAPSAGVYVERVTG